MSNLLKTYLNTENGHTFNVFYDEQGSNPIEYLENVYFIAPHGRYNLGNAEISDITDLFNWERMSKKQSDELYGADYLPYIQEVAQTQNHLLVFPIYMYEHSDIAFSLGSFNDSFDSGQLGFIVAKKSDVAAMYLKKYCTKEVIKKFEGYLTTLLNDYENYVNGNCFYIQEFDREENELNSCGGFLADYSEKALCHFLNIETLPNNIKQQ